MFVIIATTARHVVAYFRRVIVNATLYTHKRAHAHTHTHACTHTRARTHKHHDTILLTYVTACIIPLERHTGRTNTIMERSNKQFFLL